MCLSPLGLEISSDLNMIELVSGDIKLVNSVEDLIVLIKTSVEVELILEKSHRIIHADGGWPILSFGPCHINSKDPSELEVYNLHTGLRFLLDLWCQV